MRVAIYARVSTLDQQTENQVPILEKWCQDRGWNIVGVYAEEASAWKSGHQRKLAEVKELARQRKIDALVIWALDRLTREGPLKAMLLWHEFLQHKVQIISYQEHFTELPSEIAELLIPVFAWVAKQESQRRSDRTKAGILRARNEGKGKRGKDTIRRKRRWFKKPKD